MKVKTPNPTGAERTLPEWEKDPRVLHFTAICGTGMGAFAGLMQEYGYVVQGSDENVYPPMSTHLENLGIQLFKGFSSEHLSKADWVIMGNVISRGNPELEFALENSIPVLSFPEALHHFFLKKHPPLVVCGTHGKTTTSAICTYLLEQSGTKPGYFVGGILSNYQKNSSLPGKKNSPFVVEGDEYDSACFDKRPKYVHYPPKVLILTSVEFDHADIYEDLDDVKKTFKEYLDTLSSDSYVIAYGDDPNVRFVLQDCPAKIEWYGVDPVESQCDWKASVVRENQDGVLFHLHSPEGKFESIQTPMMGKHNVANLVASYAACHKFGLPLSDLLPRIQGFQGVFRRQQVRGEINGIRIVDDFAHHPTAVRVTIDALKNSYPQGNLWVLFEPRTATSRRNFFQKDYVKSFKEADEIRIAPVFHSDEIAPDQRFSVELLIQDLHNEGKSAKMVPSIEEMVREVQEKAVEGDTIAIFSNGGFGGIHDKIMASLKKSSESGG